MNTKFTIEKIEDNINEIDRLLTLLKKELSKNENNLSQYQGFCKNFIEADTISKEEFIIKYATCSTAVHCPTKDLAKEFLSKAHKFGYGWLDGVSYADEDNYTKYGSETCYNLLSGQYSPIYFFVEEGFEIVEFKGFE